MRNQWRDNIRQLALTVSIDRQDAICWHWFGIEPGSMIETI